MKNLGGPGLERKGLAGNLTGDKKVAYWLGGVCNYMFICIGKSTSSKLEWDKMGESQRDCCHSNLLKDTASRISEFRTSFIYVYWLFKWRNKLAVGGRICVFDPITQLSCSYKSSQPYAHKLLEIK